MTDADKEIGDVAHPDEAGAENAAKKIDENDPITELFGK